MKFFAYLDDFGELRLLRDQRKAVGFTLLGETDIEITEAKPAKRIEKRVGWINVYPKDSSQYIHSCKEDADGCACANRIACVKVEYEVEVEE